MCGIAGIINKKGQSVNRSEIKRMTDLIKHRGPDAEGFYINKTFGFGHRRLSILDLSDEGNQPMYSHDGRYIIAFNGEIYNYLEIKEELERHNCRFKTKTDTEVIIEAYRIWGEKCVELFNGMWAFAIYDSQQDTVFFSRDRFGVKPLYIFENDNHLVFASEIKCILELHPEERIVNEIAVTRYFSGVQEDSDEETFYANIKSFKPATTMKYEAKSQNKVIKEYWSINCDMFKMKYGDKNPYRKFREIFEDAIKIRLRSDVPIGASLSGGIDSSSIVSVISKKYGMSLNTFSSIYDEADCDEEEYIRCVNEDSKTIKHYIYPEQSKDIISDLKQMMYFHDGPCEAASPYSGFSVYKAVKGTATVMLDGQGADELFGGYLNVVQARALDLSETNSFKDKLKAMIMAGAFQESTPVYASNITDQFMYSMLGSYGYRKYAFNKSWDNPKNNALPGGIFTKDFMIKMKDENFEYPIGVATRMQKAMHYQFAYSMLPRILHDVDRNSMASSIEVRLPFLDYRLVEFAYSLDDKYKLKNSWTKYIIRKSLKKYLPKKIYSRRNKMGFPAPFDQWLRDEKYKDVFKEYVERFCQRGIVDGQQGMDIYDMHMNGKRYEWLLFKMISLEMWLEDYIDTDDYKWKIGTN